MSYVCPVCFYADLPYPPEDYNICPCCGTEFENDDIEYTYDELRGNWIDSGGNWFYGSPPDHWNAWAQLASKSYGMRTMAGDYVHAVNRAQIVSNGGGLVLKLA